MLTSNQIIAIRQILLTSDLRDGIGCGNINDLCDIALASLAPPPEKQTMTQSIAIMDNISFRLKMTPDDKERYLWLALAGETGEALNLVKKQWRDGFIEDRVRLLKTELADVYIYLRVLEAFYGMNVHQWALQKMKEVEQRPFAKPEHGKGNL